MTLEGWNHIPRGYGGDFDVAAAPWWLRLWFHTPFVDRYAYPRLVRRGHGYLVPDLSYPAGDREPITGGWRLREPGHTAAPGSATYFR
jgi:hypothetical protein